MKLYYRALEGTNTKTRRLAYLTAILSLLRREGLSEGLLLKKLLQWSQEQRSNLRDYWVQTGEVTSTRRNSAGARYLRLATRGGLIAQIAGTYRATRLGLVLFALTKHYGIRSNPFFLSPTEKIFYTYWILTSDADIFLAVLERIERQPGISLAELQQMFQKDFLARLEQKSFLSQDDLLRRQLFERRDRVANEWRKPHRYAEHLVPPRVNWMLDLGFLEPDNFRHHRYVLTAVGRAFALALPQPESAKFYDVTDQWLASGFWNMAAQTLSGIEPLTDWEHLDEKKQQAMMSTLLDETFETFRDMFVPKASLTQTLLYLSIRIVLDHRVIASPTSLAQWLSSPRTLNKRRYEVRLSPRENESYLLATIV